MIYIPDNWTRPNSYLSYQLIQAQYISMTLLIAEKVLLHFLGKQSCFALQINATLNQLNMFFKKSILCLFGVLTKHCNVENYATQLKSSAKPTASWLLYTWLSEAKSVLNHCFTFLHSCNNLKFAEEAFINGMGKCFLSALFSDIVCSFLMDIRSEKTKVAWCATALWGTPWLCYNRLEVAKALVTEGASINAKNKIL